MKMKWKKQYDNWSCLTIVRVVALRPLAPVRIALHSAI